MNDEEWKRAHATGYDIARRSTTYVAAQRDKLGAALQRVHSMLVGVQGGIEAALKETPCLPPDAIADEIEAAEERGRQQERARIIEWLRVNLSQNGNAQDMATDLEKGTHWTQEIRDPFEDAVTYTDG